MATNNGNYWLARMGLQEEQNFKPFEDYLGLSNLVQNLNSFATQGHQESGFNSSSGLSSLLLTRTCRSRSSSSSSDSAHGMASPTTCTPAGVQQVWDDFKLNGVDVDEDGFTPFAPKQIQRSRLPSVKNRRTPTWCVFCKNNGESEMVYGHHVLKDNEGRTTCPILRDYTCPICGISGDGAHTIKYCPLNKEETFPPSANLLKTARTSTGKKRELPSGLNRLN